MAVDDGGPKDTWPYKVFLCQNGWQMSNQDFVIDSQITKFILVVNLGEPFQSLPRRQGGTPKAGRGITTNQRAPGARAIDSWGSTPSLSMPQLASPGGLVEAKLRVLCLHGYAQTADIFRTRTGSGRKSLKSRLEFVYVDAPHDAKTTGKSWCV